MISRGDSRSGDCRGTGENAPFCRRPGGCAQRHRLVDRVNAKAGATLAEPGQASMYYWLLLDGEMPRRPRRARRIAQHRRDRASRRGLRRNSVSDRQNTFLVSDYGRQDSELLRFSGRSVLAADGLLPRGAQSDAGRYGGAASHTRPKRCIAKSWCRWARWPRADARTAQSRIGGKTRRLAAARKPDEAAGPEPAFRSTSPRRRSKWNACTTCWSMR